MPEALREVIATPFLNEAATDRKPKPHNSHDQHGRRQSGKFRRSTRSTFTEQLRAGRFDS